MAVFLPLQNVTALAADSKQHQIVSPTCSNITSLPMLKIKRSSIICSFRQADCKFSDSEETNFKKLEIGNCRSSHLDPNDGDLNKFVFLKNKSLASDVISICSAIKECTELGLFEDAVRIYAEMLSFSFHAYEFPCFPCLLKAFSELRDLGKAKQIHGHVLKIGITEDVYIGNSLLTMYWKCSNANDMMDMFDRMPVRDTVSWNLMISGFSRSMQPLSALKTFCKMQGLGIMANQITFLSALSACASCESLTFGQGIHAFVVKIGLDSDVSVSIGIVDVYMKCGDCTNAEQAFTQVGIGNNTVACNAMISGYVYNKCPVKALVFFHKMLVLGVESDLSTMVSTLVSCSDLADIEIGKQVHGYVITKGLLNDARVETALLDMYCKSGNIEAGLRLFKQIQNCNYITWGAIIAGCAQNSHPAEALDLFTQFISQGGRVDSEILLSVLRACSSITLKPNCLEVHGYSIKMGFDCNVFIGGALIDMYSKCGDVESAQKVLLRLPRRDVVVWNALISGYIQNGYVDDSLKAFQDMEVECVTPNTVTIACMLTVSAQLSAWTLCKQLHCFVIRNWLEFNVLISNSLLAAYARCGFVGSALYLFHKMPKKDEISWNTIISGLGMHGHTDEVFALFHEMKAAGIRPDQITFTCILSACSHTGRVNEGLQHFRSMTEDYGILPTLEHYTCMVDLLGRAGHLDQAYDLIMQMPCKLDAHVWGSLLGACKVHGDKQLGEQVANQIFRIDAGNAGYHVLLSNLYEDFGQWDNAARIRAGMRDAGLKKSPGCSWIEVNNNAYVFLAGDKSHSCSEQIYATLAVLTRMMREEGYKPQLYSAGMGYDKTTEEVILCC